MLGLRHDRGPIAPSGPERAPIAPSGPDRGLIAPSGPDRAPIAPSGPDQGEIALSLVALLYKAASSATPAVRMVPGRSARNLGGCGAVGDIARAYYFFVRILNHYRPQLGYSKSRKSWRLDKQRYMSRKSHAGHTKCNTRNASKRAIT